MNKITFGRLLDNTPAEIPVTDAEARAFDRADSYQGKLLLLRRVAFRARLVSMLHTSSGVLTSNLNCREPGPGETLVWLQSGQFSEALDRSPRIELGPQAARLLSIRGSHPKPAPPDADLLAWLDPKVGVTVKELSASMDIERSEAQRRITAMYALGLVRRNGPSDRHNPVRWYLTEDPAA